MASDLTAGAIRDKALAFGYDDCGIIPVSDLRDYADRLAERIERFPEMRGFERFMEYAFPDRQFPWAKSVVVCAGWYGRYRLPVNLKDRIGKSFLVDIRSEPRSSGRQAGERLEAFLREGGLQTAGDCLYGLAPLRWAAMKAGLGIIRKNNFFYTERGSWVWLEAWLIDARLELRQTRAAAPCSKSCALCLEACPTGALTEAYAMNAPMCVALRTTKMAAHPDDPLSKQLGNWLYGCDACQDACPHNRDAWAEDEDFPGLEEMAEGLSPEVLVNAEYGWLRERLSERLFYIGPGELWKWKVNALNAMRNNWLETYRPAVERARRDESEQVRALAEAILNPGFS